MILDKAQTLEFTRARRVEITVNLSRTLFKDENFDPTREFLGSDIDPSKLDEFLSTNRLDHISASPLCDVFKQISTLEQLIHNQFTSKRGIVDTFFIVKGAMSSSENNTTCLHQAIYAVNSVPLSRLNVIKTFRSFEELYKAVSSGPSIKDGVIQPDELTLNFNKLKVPNAIMLIANKNLEKIDAIQVNIPARVIVSTETYSEIKDIAYPKSTYSSTTLQFNIFQTCIRYARYWHLDYLNYNIITHYV